MGSSVLVLVFGGLILVNLEDTTWANNQPPSSVDFCGPQTEIHLTELGDSSSVTVNLKTPKIVQGNSTLEEGAMYEEDEDNEEETDEEEDVCILRITAPKTHAIYLQFLDIVDDEETNSINGFQLNEPCVMSIFLPDNPRVPVWKGNLCSNSLNGKVDLLTSDIRIVWNPLSPDKKVGKFLVTAVGQGPVCKEPGQHTCMRIGWEPIMCISDTLLCNGVTNCPPASTTGDEDDKLCRRRFFAPASLEQLAVELFKKWKPQELEAENTNETTGDGDVPATDQENSTEEHSFWREFQQEMEKTKLILLTTTTPKTLVSEKPKKVTDSISQVLSKYGPWGYLMLGMLICGTVLMFCGLWECCFRKPKSTTDDPCRDFGSPTTVLVINPNEPPTPPNYDELDLPPSYGILFPPADNNGGESDNNETDNKESSAGHDEDEVAEVVVSGGGDDEQNSRGRGQENHGVDDT